MWGGRAGGIAGFEEVKGPLFSSLLRPSDGFNMQSCLQTLVILYDGPRSKFSLLYPDPLSGLQYNKENLHFNNASLDIFLKQLVLLLDLSLRIASW